MGAFSTFREGSQRSAFGENMVVQPAPHFLLSFAYNINAQIVDTRGNTSGGVTQSAGYALVSSGAAANSAAYMLSKRLIKYDPGRGAFIRFAAKYTTGVANNTQFAGYGDAADGFFFGYSGATFGILRRYGGAVETRTLTITTASSTTESVTVTLDGVAKTVSVTNSGVITTTVNEIAAGDYSDTGKGWTAEAHGNTVIFTAYDTGAHAGSYSISGTTVVGSFAQTIAAAAPTETFTAQTAWNGDLANNTNVLPTIDFTKGNVYQIQFQWLGSGAIEFAMENPETGEFITVHRIKYANSATTTSILNPSLPFYVESINTTNDSAIVISISSAGGYKEGQGDGITVAGGFIATKTGITTEVPVGSVKNLSIFQSKKNRVPVKLIFNTVASDGTKTVLFRIYKNATLTAASWTAVGANTSVMATDSSASAFSGGTLIFGASLAKVDTQLLDFTPLEIILHPGESFTVTAASTVSTDTDVGFSWAEQF